MKSDKISVGDVVEVNRKGRIFTAMIKSKQGQKIVVIPLTRGISYYNISSKDVTAILKKNNS